MSHSRELQITLSVLPVFTPIVMKLAPAFSDHLGLAATLPPKEVQLQVLYWFAILVAINLQTSFLTPPFGFALFYLRGVAPEEVPTTAIYRGAIPFIVIQLIGLGLLLTFPEMVTWATD